MSGATPEQLEAEIAARRARLAGTVDQLSDRLDVKSRAKDRVQELRQRVTTDAGGPRAEVWAAAASLAALVVLVWWRRR